jgi:ribosome biogenesis GTPase
MAKGKGKSRRRNKTWHSRYHQGGEDAVDRTHRRDKFAPPEVKLRQDRFAQPENLQDLPTQEGMVVGFFPGGCLVRTENEELLCGIAKTFRAAEGSSPLAVGDTVTLALTHEASDGNMELDKDRADAMVLFRQPRRTLLSRPLPMRGKRRDEYETEAYEKIIAANMDHLLIVASVRQPSVPASLLDRYLIIAQRGELEPILVFNKIDLAQPGPKILEPYRELGVEIHQVSAKSSAGLEALCAALAGKASVLSGQSGVGKTTLVNAMIPTARGKTRSVRAKDERGRHTTSAAVVYDLPDGGILVDTPGIRELGMYIQPEELPWFFPEFEDLAGQCKFNNCTHTHEPNCAVRRAVDDGQIPSRRYRSYLRILETLQ